MFYTYMSGGYGLTEEEKEKVLAPIKESINRAVRDNRIMLMEIKKSMDKGNGWNEQYHLRQILYSCSGYGKWVTRAKNLLAANYVDTHKKEIEECLAKMQNTFGMTFDLREPRAIIYKREREKYTNPVKRYITKYVDSLLLKELK